MADLDVRGARLHVQRMGKGNQKVVFIHGYIWDNLSSLYFTIAPAVAKFAEVMLYDLRGHGKSEITATGYSLDDAVEDLVEILRQIGWWNMPIHLVGNSYGGLIAIAFAIKYPEFLSSMVVLDPELTYPEWAEKMKHNLELGGEDQKLKITREFQEWVGRYKRPEDTRLADNAKKLVFDTSLIPDLSAAPLFSDETLATIKCPVLAFYGGNSDVRHFGDRLAKTIPQCELRIIAGCSHVILWEAAARLRQEVPEWLKLQMDITG